MAVLRWLYVALWKRTETLVVLGGVLLLGALLPRISPAGLPWADPWDWFARWSFPAGLLGAATATSTLRLHCTFLARAAFAVRWQTQVGLLVMAALTAQACLALGQASTGGLPIPDPVSALGVLVLDLHLAGLAMLLLALRPEPATAAVALAGLVWAGARLAADGGGAWIGPLLDVSGHTERFGAFAQAPASAVVFCAPVLALLLLTRLQASPSRARARSDA